MQIINTDKSYRPIGPYSQATVAGNFVFTAGIGGINARSGKVESSDIREQTEEALKNIENILYAAGVKLKNVIKVNVYLKDMADFQAMNEVYARYFGAHRPARSCFAVNDMPAGERVKVEVIAEKEA